MNGINAIETRREAITYLFDERAKLTAEKAPKAKKAKDWKPMLRLTLSAVLSCCLNFFSSFATIGFRFTI